MSTMRPLLYPLHRSHHAFYAEGTQAIDIKNIANVTVAIEPGSVRMVHG